jgi:uncharacterized protein
MEPSTATPAASTATIPERLASLDWARIEAELEERGCATTGRAVLPPSECAQLIRGYDSEESFRSVVVMARHRFGRGEYKYFGYPLPRVVAALRAALYPRLAPVANRWEKALGRGAEYPRDLESFLERCHAAGQSRPTPLMLKYGEGDYNCLHQDLYGELVFPLQVAFLLSAPGEDFSGGELVLTEQRPRMQSRAEVDTSSRSGDSSASRRQRTPQSWRRYRQLPVVKRLRIWRCCDEP